MFDNRTEKLIKAIQAEDLEKVTEILEDGLDPNLLDVPTSWIWPALETHSNRPLSEACKTGNLDIVKLLVEHGATAENILFTGWSPLYCVVMSYHKDDFEMVKVLLENGADPYTDISSNEPIVFKVAQNLPINGSISTSIKAFYSNDVATDITRIVNLLIDKNSIDEKGYNGNTILMYASEHGKLSLVEYLLSEGANKLVENYQGKTALNIASERPYDKYVEDLKYDEIIELLNS